MRSILDHLAKQGDTIEAESLMIDWLDRQSLVRKPLFDELETQYATQDSERQTMTDAHFDLRLRNGNVFLHDSGLNRADLLIKDDLIAGIVSPGAAAEASEEVDLRGATVLPGAIDPHVHLGKDIRVPKDPDDAELESASAVAGGVTTMLIYLMSSEPYHEVFPVSKAVMEGNSRTDFGFHFVVGTPAHLKDIPAYVSDLGVSSFKFFMNFRGDEGAYLGMPGNDDAYMYDLLRMTADNHAMVNPHPENIELVWRLRGEPRDESAGPLAAERDAAAVRRGGGAAADLLPGQGHWCLGLRGAHQ